MAIIVLAIGRALLLLISYKNRKICKIYFYYEQLIALCSSLMPTGLDLVNFGELSLLECYKNFSFFYFKLWPCIISSMITQSLAFGLHIYIHNLSFELEEAFIVIVTLLQLLFAQLAINIIIV